MKLASIIMPVFNSQNFLDESISSMLNQTYENFEFLIIDDGSTDDSMRIISRYAIMDKRIRVFSRENRGIVHSLNQGLNEALGYWIVRMDADDISYPNRIESQIQYMLEHNLDVSGTWVKKFGAVSGFIKPSIMHHNLITDLLFKSCFVHPSTVIRRNVFDNLKYDSNYKHAEDYQLWCSLASRGYKFGNIPEVLLMYRVHSSQISNMNSEAQKNISEKISKNYLVNFLQMNYINYCEFKNLIDNFHTLYLLNDFGYKYFIKIHRALNGVMKFHFIYLVKKEMIKISVMHSKVIYAYINLSISSCSFTISHLIYLFISIFLNYKCRVKFNDFCRSRLGGIG